MTVQLMHSKSYVNLVDIYIYTDALIHQEWFLGITYRRYQAHKMSVCILLVCW